MNLFIPMLLPLLGGAVIFALKDAHTRRTVTIGVTVLSAMAAMSCAFGPARSVCVLRMSGTLSLAFGVDELSRFFLVLLSVVWCLVLLFAFRYMTHEGGESRFFGFFTITYGAVAALVMAQNMVTLYMCFELMTLLSMPLVLHNGTEIARKAAMKYLGYSVLGAGLALMGFFLLADSTGNTAFLPGGVLGSVATASNSQTLLIAWLLMAVGFGCKAGLLPLQAWLTTAHPVAPSPASAVLSGIITKGGVLAIVRVTFYLFGADFLRGTWAQHTLLILSLMTVFMGSMLALKARVLKKRLAYSTISQVSYVLFGLFLLNESGLVGAFLQVAFHALAKDALFLAAGAMIFATGYTEVAQLRGIGRRMPVTLWCFTIASLSLVGIPPTGGFISKWYLALGALERGQGALGTVGVAVLLISALLTAFYLLRIVSAGFFPGRAFETGERCEVQRDMLLPMLLLAAGVVVLGLFPNGLIQWLQGLAAALL